MGVGRIFFQGRGGKTCSKGVGETMFQWRVREFLGSRGQKFAKFSILFRYNPFFSKFWPMKNIIVSPFSSNFILFKKPGGGSKRSSSRRPCIRWRAQTSGATIHNLPSGLMALRSQTWLRKIDARSCIELVDNLMYRRDFLRWFCEAMSGFAKINSQKGEMWIVALLVGALQMFYGIRLSPKVTGPDHHPKKLSQEPYYI